MVLPLKKNLPINLLASCFNSTSATYKYYWLLSIIQEVEMGNTKIRKIDLFARMISNAWYTVNYFHVSFGKQDLIQKAVHLIKDEERISIDENFQTILNKISKSAGTVTQNQLLHFNNNVPHWFLSPWFPKKSKAEIYADSKKYCNYCIYALYDEHIVINPEWTDYLISNSKILKDFCYWNLSLFLQTRNPNVPNIPNKLFKPPLRGSLQKQRKGFWNFVLRNGSLKCIYTGKELTIGNYAVEHFVPYSFVLHDLMWNLIPADSSFNSSKSNKLPRFERFFPSFFDLQRRAVDMVRKSDPKNKFLEDYLTIFPDLNSFNKEDYSKTIQPLITIASNNGFEYL
ncbi:MAG: hypothetical protein K1X85_01590 [Ignavibacteria bacterium]|nr:hypothetical protein [Ignavibacteria bacterium]